MFDVGNFATGNVRLALNLRRWRNGNGNRNDDARHRSHDGRRDINFDGNLGDIGSVDLLWHAGNVGADGNVRLRFEQHHGIVEPDVNLPCHVEQRPSRGNSDGILRDRQSRGERSVRGADANRIAHRRNGRIELVGTDDAYCSTHDRKHNPVNHLHL
jgi:hypothetical protein